MTTPLQLESLFVTITAETKQFTAAIEQVNLLLNGLQTTLAGIATSAAASLAPLAGALTQLANLTAGSFSQLEAALATLPAIIGNFGTLIAPLAGVSTTLETLATMLDRFVGSLWSIGSFFQRVIALSYETAAAIDILAASFARFTGTSLRVIVTGINELTASLEALMYLDLPAISNILLQFAAALVAVAQPLQAIAGIGATGFSGAVAALGELGIAISTLAGVAPGSIGVLAGEIATLVGAMAGLTSFNIGALATFTKALATLVTMPTATLSANMAGLAAALAVIVAPLKDLAYLTAEPILAIGRLIRVLISLSKIPPINLGTLPQQLADLGTALATMSTLSAAPINAVARLMMGLASLAQVAATSAVGIVTSTTAINAAFAQLKAGINLIMPELQALSAMAVGSISAFAALVSAFARLASVDVVTLGGAFAELTKVVGALVPILNTLGGPPVAALARLTSALVRLAAVPKGVITALALEIDILTVSIAKLAAVPVSSTLVRLIATIGRLSSISAAAFTPLIASINTLTASLGRLTTVANVPTLSGVGKAAGSSVLPVGRFNRSLNDLTVGARTATGSLSTLRLSFGFLTAYGVFAFAKLDDSITRAMARMGEFNPTVLAATQGFSPIDLPSRQVDFDKMKSGIQKGILDVYTRSTSKASDLGDAFSWLERSGMGAKTAIDALSIAENLAVVSGMKATQSARELVDVLRAVGRGGETPKERLSELQHLSDVLVGVARQTGSTEEQLSTAFTHRFVTAMKIGKMTMEESIALLGVYSKALGKGSQAGDLAARTIMQLSGKEIMNFHWDKDQMGVDIRDATGNFKPFAEILDVIDKKIRTVSGKTTHARLMTLGFDTRSAQAIAPLIGESGLFKDLMGQMGGFEGISKKMADMIRGDFLSQIKILWHNLTAIAIVIGDMVAPAISMLAKGIETLTSWFRALNPAFQNLIGLALLAYVALIPLAKFVIWFAAKTILAPIMAALTPVRLLFSTIASLAGLAGNAVLYAGRVMWSGFKLMISGLLYVSELLWRFMGFLAKAVILESFSALAKATTAGLAGLAQFLLTLGFWLLTIPFQIALAITAFAVFAALVLTVGGTLVTIFGGIAAAIVAAWKGFQNTIKQGWDWAQDKGQALQDSVVGVWERGKEGARGFMEASAEAVTNLAGFFWNFAQNMEVLFQWISKNWRTILEDMGNIFVAFVENSVTNIKVLGGMIIDVGVIMFKGFWNVFAEYAGVAFKWVRENWANMFSDMWSIVKVFVTKLVENFKTLIFFMMELFVALQDPATWIGKNDKIKNTVEKYIGTISTDFQLGFDKIDFKTGKGEQPNYGVANANAMNFMTTAWAQIADVKNTAFGKLVNTLEGFKAVTPLPEFNLALPEDWVGKLGDWVKKLMHPVDPEDIGQLTGKEGPGFQFKQISLERYMLGGEVNARLDYEQLFVAKGIAADVRKIAAAMDKGDQTKVDKPQPEIPFIFIGP